MDGSRDVLDEALGIAGRLALLGGLSAAVLFVLGILLKPAMPMGLPPGDAGRVLLAMLIAISLGVGTLLAGVILERQRWEVLGLGVDGLHPVRLLTSLGLGIVVIGLPATLLLRSEVASLQPSPSTAGLLAYARAVSLPILVITARDELVFRGYLHGLLSDRWGGLAAVGLTAVAYTLWSAGMPMADPVAWTGVLALGVFLGVVRERTRGVVASWLAASGFAWVQVALLHAPFEAAIVGHPPFYHWGVVTPTWWSGGATGVGAAPITAATLVLVSFLVFRTRPSPPRSTRD